MSCPVCAAPKAAFTTAISPRFTCHRHPDPPQLPWIPTCAPVIRPGFSSRSRSLTQKSMICATRRWNTHLVCAVVNPLCNGNPSALGKPATSWQASDAALNAGGDGMIYRSRKSPDRWHLVLWHWNTPGCAQIQVDGSHFAFDPGKKFQLPRK